MENDELKWGYKQTNTVGFKEYCIKYFTNGKNSKENFISLTIFETGNDETQLPNCFVKSAAFLMCQLKIG